MESCSIFRFQQQHHRATHVKVQPSVLALAAFAWLLLASTGLRQLNAERQPLVQYFQMVHTDADNLKDTTSSFLENASRIVVMDRHSYDICCYSQPVGSRNQLQFDTNVFTEYITNYQHAQSVSSCIQTTRGVSVAGRLSRSDFNGTVVCESFSAGDGLRLSGWFYYDLSVPPKLDCDWSPLSSVQLLDQEIKITCEFSTGWPLAIPLCWLGSGGLHGSNNTQILPLEATITADGRTILTTKLPALKQLNGRSVQCSAEQTCPQGSMCNRDLLAKVHAAGLVDFKVRSASFCIFSPSTLRNVTHIKCNSTEGIPEANQFCTLIIGSKEIKLPGNRSLSNDTSPVSASPPQQLLVTEFFAPMASTPRPANASISCRIAQSGLSDIVFIHDIAVEPVILLSSASIDWAPIIVSLIILLLILIVILIMVAVAVKRRRSAGLDDGAGVATEIKS